MASVSFLTQSLFTALRWNMLSVGSSAWNALASNPLASQAARDAAGLYSVYSTYRNASATQIFGALRTGAITTAQADQLWFVLQNTGGGTQAQYDAYNMWTAYQTYGNASATQLFNALKSGALPLGTATQLWNTLSATGQTTQAERDAYSMWTAYSTYRTASAAQLFQAIKSGELVQGGQTWTLLYTNGVASQAQRDAVAMWNSYSTYRNANAQQLFDALRSGALSQTGTVWTALSANGVATQAQRDASTMWIAYGYRNASAQQIFDALKSGALPQGDLTWTALSAGGITQAQRDASTMWSTFQAYKDASGQQLFDAIKAGKLTTSGPAWNALLSNGAQVQSQRDAVAMWNAYQTYKAASAQQLFDALKSGALTENSLQWKALYVNGAASQAQVAADKLWVAANAAPQVSATSWTDALSDATLKALTKTAMADGQISYSELFGILNSAKTSGLSMAEYQDLQSLLKNGKSAMSSYVYDITNKVVNGDSDWKTVAPVLPGASSGQVQNQLNKWFLGTERPVTLAGLTYTVDTAKLYGATGKGSLDDINQGQLGDCYLLASMACLSVQEDASFFKSMIQDNGNNTYGVRFFLNGREDWVTVDNTLPTFNDKFRYASAQTLWAGLVEKAYVQLNETGALGHAAGNAYSLIAGGSAETLSVLTNKSVSYHYTSSYATATAWNVEKQGLVNALNNHQEVWVGSSKDLSASGAQTFVSAHAFAVIGYDTSTGNFILRNPWGNAKPATNSAPWVASNTGKYWTQFEASMADLFADGAVVATTLSQAVVAGAASAAATVKSAVADMAGAKDPAASLLNDPNKNWGVLASG